MRSGVRLRNVTASNRVNRFRCGTEMCMLICMQSTSVRIDTATHDDLKRLAAEFDTTVGNTVTLAVRALRQDHIGRQLHTPLVTDEDAWLDAELG